MEKVELISLIITFIGVVSFAIVFTVLYRSYTKSTIQEVSTGQRDIDLIDMALYEKEKKNKKSTKVLKMVKNILFYTILAIVVPIFIFSIVNRFQGRTTMIGDKGIMVVASGSMSEKHKNNKYLDENKLNNQFNTYDIIVLEKVDSAEEIELYDVIAFKNNKGINIIHRVVDFKDVDGEIRYVTQGDANGDKDDYNPSYSDLVGRYTNNRVKTLGIFIIFFQSYSGMITIASLVFCLVMIDRYNLQIENEQEKRMTHLGAIIDQINDNDIDNIKTSFKETICYKGFIYHFDENGFVDKEELEDEELSNKSENTIIKIVEKENLSKEIEEIKVDSEIGGN